MVRVGILGKTDSARRKGAIVTSSGIAELAEPAADPRVVIESSELVVLTEGNSATRSELAALALRRGRHVFSDWPAAGDVEALQVLARTAEESGVELAVNRPDRLHPHVRAFKEKAPTLTDVSLSAGRHYRFDNLVADAVDLCLYLNGSSPIHRYEAEATRDTGGAISALSFALRFHSGSLALGHIRRTEDRPVRHVFVAGTGWNEARDLLHPEPDETSAPYDPSIDERSFVSCLECLSSGKPVQTALHDLEGTVRAVDQIMARTRGQT